MIDLKHSRNLAVRLPAGCFLDVFLLPVLIAGLGLMMLASRVAAQTFLVLHSFPSGNDGAYPVGGLLLSSNILFGTTEYGGTFGNGTVFAVTTDGTGFTNLWSFAGGSNGANPQCGLILSSNTLYGTTASTVFAINTDGTGFTNLHNFTGRYDGGGLYAGLTLSSNTLYGTTQQGGTASGTGGGTLFAVSTDGTGFNVLHSFTNGLDGANPLGVLILSGNSIYGTTWKGGIGVGGSQNGTVFALNTNGTGFTNLHSFPQTQLYNGAGPQAGLVLVSNTLYGTTYQGGSSGNGTVFAINTDGTGFTNLHNFTGSDGAAPDAATLALSGNTLYGTADSGGSYGGGAVFAINTDGTGFTVLHSFSGTDGTSPLAGLVLANNTLYGTALLGGIGGKGTIFSILIQPQLTITPSGPNVILSWPTNFAGFDYTGYTLQSSTNLASPLWNTNLPPPVFVNGQLTVTNPISGTQRFFRLSQ